ncbi:hypothetical protein K3495_g6216 [Podosphaera aphanis]|nr:hypothetical protein K3495_g6216 [Podosphaera aphanis]
MMGAEKHRKVTTPVVDYNSLRSAPNKDIRIDVKEYQKAIGSLMLAIMLTRPDIAFAMGKLSQFMSDPAEHHGQALKHLMRYLRSIVHQKIRDGPGGVDTRFLQYTDADWASDVTDRKSVSGSVAMFYGGPICWSRKKQRSVATSSGKSEYIAMASSRKLGPWVAQIFRDLKLTKDIRECSNMVQMKGDNQGAIALAKNPHLHEHSKRNDLWSLFAT